MATVPATEQKHVLDAEGHFSTSTTPPIEPLALTSVEDWLSLGLLLAARPVRVLPVLHALCDERTRRAWTEEIARYLLMSTVFVGIAAAVRRTRPHSRRLPLPADSRGAGRALSTAVDIGRIVFFVAAVGLTAQMMMRMERCR
jgi:hypothetical protein